jgi:hypothetical protein
VEPGSTPRPLVQKRTWGDSLPIDMLLSAVSVLAVAQSSSEIPEGLTNNPVIRIIFGPTKAVNCIWRIKTNKVLDELIKHRNIINYVKAQILSWFGHTNRKPETSIV